MRLENYRQSIIMHRGVDVLVDERYIILSKQNYGGNCPLESGSRRIHSCRQVFMIARRQMESLNVRKSL